MKVYKLEDRTPVECRDMVSWALWFEHADRRVAHDEIAGIRISTVFLGIDHNYAMEGEPILFETMVFGGQLDLEQWRYRTWEEAEEGHGRAVEEARSVLVN